MCNIREDFIEFCRLVHHEYNPLVDSGVFDHSTFNLPKRTATGTMPPECTDTEVQEELAEYDRVMVLRKRCRKFWPLEIITRKIQQVIDYQATGRVDTEELEKLMVATMLTLTQARDCISDETRQKYITLIIKLRTEGLIKRKMLHKYSLFQGLVDLVTS